MLTGWPGHYSNDDLVNRDAYPSCDLTYQESWIKVVHQLREKLKHRDNVYDEYKTRGNHIVGADVLGCAVAHAVDVSEVSKGFLKIVLYLGS